MANDDTIRMDSGDLGVEGFGEPLELCGPLVASDPRDLQQSYAVPLPAIAASVVALRELGGVLVVGENDDFRRIAEVIGEGMAFSGTEGFASRDCEEINHWLEARKQDIRLEDWAPNLGVGFAGVTQTSGMWLFKGTPQRIRLDTGEIVPGVQLKNGMAGMGQMVKAINLPGLDNPVVSIALRAEGQDKLNPFAAMNPEEEADRVILVNQVDSVYFSEARVAELAGYMLTALGQEMQDCGKLILPMAHIEGAQSKLDPTGVTGVTVDIGGQSIPLTQAILDGGLRLDEEGFTMTGAFAAAAVFSAGFEKVTIDGAYVITLAERDDSGAWHAGSTYLVAPPEMRDPQGRDFSEWHPANFRD